MVAERSIDVRLVSATATSLGLEPGYDVRVEPQRNLLLYRPVEDSAPGVGPIENLRDVGRVDLVVCKGPARGLATKARASFSSSLLGQAFGGPGCLGPAIAQEVGGAS